MAKKVFKSFIAIFSSFVILVAVVGNGSVSQAVTSSFVETGVKEKITDFSFGLIENYFKKGDEKPSNTNSVTKNQNDAETLVYLGGFPIGIKLYCDGVVVVDTQNVETSGAVLNPAQKAGILKGDIIK